MAVERKQEGSVYLRWMKEEGIDVILPERLLRGENAAKDLKPAMTAEFKALRDKVLQCTLCKELCRTRKSVVFGSGNPQAALMFVGEAPGHDEDVQGLPFVGAAGQLLTKIIEAIGFSREEVFIANVLKCRPPQNRPPKPEEIDNCRPFLENQIEMIRPKIICALGTFAAQTLLQTEDPISRLRGKFTGYPGQAASGIQVMCTYHPAYLLRNPSEKRKVWEDMKKIRKELDENSPSS